jgi:hypothetical protein
LAGSSGDDLARQLWDRDRIARRPKVYARGIDRRDWDLVRSCFTPDAQIEGSRATATAADYITQLRPGVEYYPTTMHFMGNQLVELDGDTGQVETYAVAYHWKADVAGEDHPENLIVGVRYHDTLVRSADDWLISFRHVDPDWRVGTYPPV